MSGNVKKWFSAVLALLMVVSPITAYMEDEQEFVDTYVEEPAEEVPEVVEAPAPTEVPVTEAPATEAPAAEAPAAEVPAEDLQPAAPEGEVAFPEESAPDDGVIFDDDVIFDDGFQMDDGPSFEEAPAPEPTEAPVIAVSFDMSHVVNPVYVPYGTPEGELPLPAEMPMLFSNGQVANVPVVWFCTGNTFDGQGYIAACEQYEVTFYFQATPVGIICDPGMAIPALTVMYQPQAIVEPVDHEGINFQGTDIVVSGGARVTVDDILNETGYDPGYRIVVEGAVSAGESGRVIPNPVLLCGTIAGGNYEGEIEIAGGVIAGGEFSGRIVSSNGTIRGGRFLAPVTGNNGQILVTIEGGEFRGDIGDSESDGCVYIEGGAFYGNVRAGNLAVNDAVDTPVFYNADGERGAQRIVTVGADGVIADGVFYADVRNANNITGGTFYGKVTNAGSVLGGAFLSDFDNLEGARIAASESDLVFPNATALNNSGAIDAGERARFSGEMLITNNGGGTIASGTFPCKVVNYGTITGGTFQADVVNMGAICGGDFPGRMYNEGGTIVGATINCMMSNKGLITLQGIVADAEARIVTIAAGTQATTDEILERIEAAGGDPAEYVIRNDGEITGGSRSLDCDFEANKAGAISGGEFRGTVYAGQISGGTFYGAVFAQSIQNGEFGGRVNVEGEISGGTFVESSVVTAGVISGGTFRGRITSQERVLKGFITITGGAFSGGVATVADDGIVINGGTFDCEVGYCADASRDVYDGYVIVRRRDGVAEPKFNGSYVGGHNVVVECGVFSENTKVVMYSMGTLAGGEFNGPVICNNAILGGTYRGEVTVNAKPNGQIHGGTFYGKVNNKENAYISESGYGDNPPPKFLGGEVENEGVMDPGDGAEFGEDVVIVNRASGNIQSGVYRSPVTNYGTISGGVFCAPVTAFKSIHSDDVVFKDILLDVPEATITISKDATKSIAEIKEIDGYAAGAKIINEGTITGSGDEELPNDVENRGIIEGGSFTGTVTLVGYEGKLLDGGRIRGGTFKGAIHSYYGVISGGTFDGNVELDGEGILVVTITGGTFNGTVGRSGDGYVFVYRADDSKKVLDEVDPSGPVFNQKVAARNLNITCGTFNGPVEMSTVGVIANGVFHGPVVCHNNITGGEFFETVEVCKGQNSHIEGGLFHKGTTIEAGTAIVHAEDSNGAAIAFDGGEIVNDGVLDPGDEAVFGEDVTILNTETGRILSGVYRGAVRNYGMISNSTFFGAMENHSRIVNSELNGSVSGAGTSTVEGVKVEGNTITIEAGSTISANMILSQVSNAGDLSNYTIINNGVITEGGVSIPCDVYGGTIKGGSYTGTVCVRKISGGKFTGMALAQTISGGEFSDVVYVKAISSGSFHSAVHDYSDDTIGALPAALKEQADTYLSTDAIPARKGGLGIGGGSFYGTVGGSGESVFVRGGDFENCQGLKAYNLTVGKGLSTKFGEDCGVEFTVGDIGGGTFAGTVTNNNNVTGGTFNGKMINRGTIYGGAFNGGIDNYGLINGGATYTAYSEDWTYDSSRSQWVPHGEPSQKRVTESDVSIDCTLTNNAGGVVMGMVEMGEHYELVSNGGLFETCALIATPGGESKIYSGERILCGAPVLETLAAIDEAERLKSEWTYLDGSEIEKSATISSNPAENAFLRDFNWDIRDGELQLGMDWSEATAVPKADYRSVRILSGATVSGGVWNVPVVNEGTIAGGTFNRSLTNQGSVSGAKLNGEITARAGTIENCTYGPGASVASVAEGARIRVNVTVNGETRTAAYGANALEALNAIQSETGYEWYSLDGAEAAVKSADTIPLTGGKYELRKRPVPEILWPTASDIGVNEPLGCSELTSSDPNGTFYWRFPNQVYNSAGMAMCSVGFRPNPDNAYNYEGIATTKSIPVQIRGDILVISVNASFKYYSSADPANWSAKVTGSNDRAVLNALSYEFVRDPGEDVGEYALTAQIVRSPANYTVHVVPSTFTIRPKDLNSLFSASMGTVRYTGDELEPVPTVKDLLAAKVLTYGTDFTVSYDKEIREAGDYAYTITGTGNYTGSIRKQFSVMKGEVVVRTDSLTKAYGEADPEFASTVVSGLSEGAEFDYELYRVNASKEGVGTYSILPRVTKGGDKFSVRLEKNATLTITPKQLPDEVTPPETQFYDGSAIAAKPVVKDGGVTLTEGRDYTLRYLNNVNAGTATVIITGTGNYSGERRTSFQIRQAERTGWQRIDGEWYYYSVRGAMMTGWQSVGGKWYYMNARGVMTTGWQNVGGRWYYMDANGAMTTGWAQVSGKWYYMDASGAMTTGWQSVGGKWYYMDASGAMATGWTQVGGKWYYLDNTMATGWKQISGKWYYFDANGVMQSGWLQLGSKWYYLDNTMATGWKQISGKWYYFDANGVMQSGWLQLGSKWYYLDNAMATGWKQVGGKWYYMDANGAMQSGWLKLGNTWYFLDNTMVTGWKQVSGTWYYFNANGAMQTGKQVINGKTYVFNGSGALVS